MLFVYISHICDRVNVFMCMPYTSVLVSRLGMEEQVFSQVSAVVMVIPPTVLMGCIPA